MAAHADSNTQESRWQNPVTADTATSTAKLQHHRHPASKSAPASGSLHLSFLFKRAQQNVKQLLSSDVKDFHSGKHEHLDAFNQSTQPLHTPEQGGNTSTHQGTHNASLSGNVTGTDTSAPDPSDILHVMREAEELGFEAAVFSSDLSPDQAQHDTAAHGATPNNTHTLTPAAVVTVDDDHSSVDQSAMVGKAESASPSLGLLFRGLGQASSKSSSSRLQMPEQVDEEDATSFAIDALDADALTEKVAKAASTNSQDEETDPAVCVSSVLSIVLLLPQRILS